MGRVGFRRSCLVRDLALTASRIVERAGWADGPGAIKTRKIAGLCSARRLTSLRNKVLWSSPERLTHSTLDTPPPAALPSILDGEDSHDGLRAGMGR
jgi:hypothetical protein